LDAATAALDPPLAAVDLEAWDANAATLAGRASGKPIRVASKSVRSRDLLRDVLARPGWHGVMAYTLAEALWLVDGGVTDDVLLGSPSADGGALTRLAFSETAAATITLMIDSEEQLDLIDAVCPPASRPPLRVCLDLDASWRTLGGRVHVGV